MTYASRNEYCPGPDCTFSARTVEGLHDHIDTFHEGESLRSLERKAAEEFDRDPRF